MNIPKLQLCLGHWDGIRKQIFDSKNGEEVGSIVDIGVGVVGSRFKEKSTSVGIGVSRIIKAGNGDEFIVSVQIYETVL